MDSIEPFNFDDLVDYNHAYLSGFLAEKYDVASDKAIERASFRAMNTTVDTAESTVIHQTKTPTANNVKIEKVSDDHILLPVWMVNIDYNGKKYTFAMNGQTGELVGNIPIDKLKAFIIAIAVFVICFIVTFLILGGVA